MRKRKDEKVLISLVIIFFVLLSSVGAFFYFKFFTTTEIVSEQKPLVLEPLTQLSYNNVTINVPAVDNEGRGAIVKLKIQTIPGEGRTLVNVDNLLFWVDTQFSIRVAKFVAENITNLDLSNIDLIYTIETNASVIEGQSAGAALTVATVAALQNKSLNENVIITGTVNPNGRIGAVGGIFSKAKASKEMGATLFLVPRGQGTQVSYKPEQKCEKIGPVTFCSTEYKETKIDISKDVGIEVKEVTYIQEALKYLLT